MSNQTYTNKGKWKKAILFLALSIAGVTALTFAIVPTSVLCHAKKPQPATKQVMPWSEVKKFFLLSSNGSQIKGVEKGGKQDYQIMKICAEKGYDGIEIGPEISSIDKEAFYGPTMFGLGSPIRTISMHNVTSIGSNAFTGCGIVSIELLAPTTFTYIGEKAFYGCPNFTGFTGATMTLADDNASIGMQAFQGCPNLTVEFIKSINFLSTNNIKRFDGDDFAYIAPVDFDFDLDKAWSAGSGCLWAGKIHLNKQLSLINDHAFSGCASITSIINKGSGIISSIGAYAFDGCEKLRNITNDDYTANAVTFSSTNSSAIGEYAFSSCANLSVTFIRSIVLTPGGTALSKHDTTNYAYFTPNTFSLGESSAYATNSGCLWAGDVPLNKNATLISAKAFAGCASITSIINNSGGQISSIGESAFEGCKNIKKIEDGTIKLANDTSSLGEKAFRGCTNLTIDFLNTISIVEGNEIKKNSFEDDYTYFAPKDFSPSKDKALSGGSGCLWAGSDIKFTNLTSICTGAFYGCGSVHSIKIGTNPISIGWDAFMECAPDLRIIFE